MRMLFNRFKRMFVALILASMQIVPFMTTGLQKAAAADTGFLTSTSTHSPNNWDTNTVGNIQTSNDQYVSDNDGDFQGYSSFNIPSITSGSTIDGIEVRAEAKSSDTSGCKLGISLS